MPRSSNNLVSNDYYFGLNHQIRCYEDFTPKITKKTAKRDKKRLKIARNKQRKKEKVKARKEAYHVKKKSGDATVQDTAKEKREEKAMIQNEAWVNFQQNIAVSGFDTGQVLKARVVRQSDRKSGSAYNIKPLKASEVAAMKKQFERPELPDIKSGNMPALRYSDEETEKLLKMAHDALPKRAGKRGTRNLKRQKRRWFLVRKIHAKKKQWKIREHHTKMLKRSQKVQRVQKVIKEAPDIIEQDRLYQEKNFQRWLRTMTGASDNKDEGDGNGYNDNNGAPQNQVQQLEP